MGSELKLTKLDKVKDFADRVIPYLMSDECFNNLQLSILLRLVENPNCYCDTSEIYMALVEDKEGRVAGVFLRTPPHKLLVSKASNAALELVAKDFSLTPLTGVLGSKECAQYFARYYCQQNGRQQQLRAAQKAFKLETVLRPKNAVAGFMRPATAADIPILIEFNAGFIRDASLDPKVHDPAVIVERSMTRGGLMVWEKGGSIMSTANHNRDTPNGANIGFVYTPKEFRGKGYASAFVASLSQKLLDDGKRFCFLFTDLSNPTSNKIYQDIGYKPIADFDEIDFLT